MTLEQAKELADAVVSARPDARALLLLHAVDDSEPCDPEYCPWSHYPDRESLCVREEAHTPGCRCAECANDD